jgi:hypothetical protein
LIIIIDYVSLPSSVEEPHMAEAQSHSLLVYPIPQNPVARTLIYAIRKIAVGGLNDAFAAHAMLSLFGSRSRRPLLLLRALMAELARVSRRQLVVGPCCCPRATLAEAELLLVISLACERPAFVHARLCQLLAVEHALGALSSAQAVDQACADLGHPLSVHALGEAGLPGD